MTAVWRAAAPTAADRRSKEAREPSVEPPPAPGLILVTINPAYRLSELEFALNKVRCAAVVTATAFKTSDYVGMLNTLAPELAVSPPGQLAAGRLPRLRIVIQIGGPLVARAIPFDAVAAHGGDAERAELAACRTHEINYRILK